MHFRFLPLFASLLAATFAGAADLKLTDGTVLKNARIQRVDGAIVVVLHEGGEARVPLRRLDPAMQRDLLGVSIGSVNGLTTNASRAAAARQSGASPEGVVVTATAIPVVEPYALTPEDALSRRLFDDVARKRAERAAKDAKSVWTLPPWRYVPFKLVDVNAADPAKSSPLKWDLQPASAATYGAPDPRTGK